MNEDEQLAGFTADDEGVSYEEDGSDLGSIANAESGTEEDVEAGAETTTEDAGTEDEQAVDWKARAEELEAKWKAVEDVADYADVTRNLRQLGTPDEVRAILTETQRASYAAALEQEEHKGRSIAQAFMGNLSQQTGVDAEELAPFQTALADFLAPLMKELAEMRPIRDAWQTQNQTSALDNAVSGLKTKYPQMDEESVRREYQAGRNGELEAVRTHTRYETLGKAATQDGAIDALKNGDPAKRAPNVPSARGRSATSPGRAINLPDPVEDPEGFDKAWKEQLARAKR